MHEVNLGTRLAAEPGTVHSASSLLSALRAGLQSSFSLCLGPPPRGRRCGYLGLSAGRCLMPPLPTFSDVLGLSTGSPRAGPGWKDPNKAECRGWVTARCPTLPSYPGLRKARKFPLLSLQDFLLVWGARVDAGR